MNTFILDVIPNIRKFSRTLDDVSIFTNHHWVLLNEIANHKKIYIFREHKKLLVSENGVVTKGNWEFLGHNSILLDVNHKTLLLKHIFVDEHVMVLKIDGLEEHLFLVNDTRYSIELNTVDDVVKFLQKKYLKSTPIPTKTFVLNHDGIPPYRESFPKKSFDLSFGYHDKIHIYFANGIEGRIFKGYSTNKYFFYHPKSGRNYFENKVDCINSLYKNKRY